MKNKVFQKVAAILAALFVCGTGWLPSYAAPSNEAADKDYRNMDIVNKQGVRINKPTAQFSANRVVNGAVTDMAISYADFDCNAEFPTLICYVGDTLTFTDMSRDNNGGSIIEWDWQYYGALGNHHEIYQNNIVNESSFTLTEPGETMFYLCVRGNEEVKQGCCDLWSENGNHQTVGINKWFPEGAYWYFTGVRVVVKPLREAIVHVRYWDAEQNKIFHEGYVNSGVIYNDTDTIETSVHITDWEGYAYSGWNVQLMDGTIQYSGTDRDVGITLAGWLPEKYLNVEFYPYADTSVEVRYWDSAANQIIHTELLQGEKTINEQEITVTANLTPPSGYQITDWNVQLVDGSIQYTGAENPVQVILNGYIPKKYLNVNCQPIHDKRLTVKYLDKETGNLIETKILYPEDDGRMEVDFDPIPGYVIENWTLKLPDGTALESGTEAPVEVILTTDDPHKILEVECLKIIDSGEDTETQEPLPPSTVDVKPSGICDGIISWTETESHRVFDGYTSTGKRRYHTCTHTFRYQAVLGAVADITPDTLKSGYGFEVGVRCTVDTKLVANTGGCRNWGNGRKASVSVKNPTQATVYIPWDMTNRLGTQSKAIEMEPDGTLKFKLPVSNVSEAGARKIYTPVELPGTEEQPVAHEFEIYITGGGVRDVEFCQKLIGRITINGDMYSDDFSGAN